MKKFLLTAAVALGALTVAAVGAQAKFTFALVPLNWNRAMALYIGGGVVLGLVGVLLLIDLL